MSTKPYTPPDIWELVDRERRVAWWRGFLAGTTATGVAALAMWAIVWAFIL